ncbi:MAG: chromosomal replication initiator protein DnaA [Lachnospiraceae bacterium]|nr:chromosomal replication initiator protein DnaA [Lachnospiraceae bacterium]
MDELIKKWDEIKESIRIEYEVSDLLYNTWINLLKPGEIKDNTIYIVAPKEQAQSLFVINKKYHDAFKININEALGRNFEDQYEVAFIAESDDKEPVLADENININKEIKYKQSNLRPEYTFDTFVVGNNNRLAQASAVAVADNPGEFYNPLFIYGGVGLGKTHLMHAIGHYIIDKNPDANVLYVTSADFTNEIVEGLRLGYNNPDKMKEVKDKYRNVDVLLIDDIEFIIGKDRTQEEFFHTFNQLYDNHKQIVITSDKPPKDMEILEERFRSRFAWGLTVDIQFPDFETKMAILQKKIETFGYDIDNEVLSYIANNVNSNIRELEGSIKKVVAFAALEKRKIDIETAKEALKDIVSPNAPSKITPENIMNVVCDHYSISIEDIKSSKRNKELVYPRKMIMYLCRYMTSATYKEIASYLGGRDHTTIMYGIRTITDLLEKDESTKRTIETIINKIKSD